MMRKGWWTSLYVQVLVAITIGVVLGIFSPDFAVKLKPLGDAFIALVKMVIGPVIFLTVVVGIAKMGDLRHVGRIGVKALIYFEVMTTAALVLGLVVANLRAAGRRHGDRPGRRSTPPPSPATSRKRADSGRRRFPARHHPAHLRVRLHRRQPAAGAC